jgi:hypothetical protein
VQLPDTISSDDPYAEHNVLVQGLGDGRFQEVMPKGGTAQELLHTSRGIGYGDVNGDGAVDIVVLNRDAPAYLLMNQNPEGGGFVKLRLVNKHGAPAQNAVVRFMLGDKKIRREVRTGGGYCSAHDPTLHIGLGINKTISGIEVTWSDCTKQTVGTIEAGTTETVQQR